MAITFDIDHQADITVFAAQGRLSRQEVEQAIAEFYESGPTTKVLWDINQASVAHFHERELRKIVRVISERAGVRPEGKTAIVTSRDSDFGVLRMGGAYAHNAPLQLGVFRSQEQALLWLDG